MLGESHSRNNEEWVYFMTTVENLTGRCKLLGRTGSQKSQRVQMALWPVQFSFYGQLHNLGETIRIFIWKYGMELRISLKAVEGDTSKSRQ